ncbi:MAG: respiratory nitrate reductase subunit gamma [Betaproteobacteria bacterium RIFCSPLOWO2_02_FULL_65_24]|nr:MAG: respiratory nitrate reductase subunit gamma [Betaproteobacteria bacterium RIFCSPLOWO2_02_FULL_65_24]OGA97036.1 MAG: respiratory nitrate reductase subunit gamma [Betaproteobacteria bacterium RIFCSPLOWO2_12_FULL_66_14]
MNQFLFGIYPYIALAAFLVGSLIRYDREQYTWKSDSSQLLRRGQLRWGSNLFHLGILGIFFGHLVGLLTPVSVWHALGLSLAAKQMIAMVGGGLAGLACLAGLLLLIQRRLYESRIRSTSRVMDHVVLYLLLAQVLLGLYSITVSVRHLDGAEMMKFVNWAQAIFTLRPGAANHIADVAWVFKAHLTLGLTIFLVFPFSRLVHIWSGFGSVAYLTRPYQIVRTRS